MANYRTHDERETAFEKMERRKRRVHEKQQALARGFAAEEGGDVDGGPTREQWHRAMALTKKEYDRASRW
jgi:hypothetical protein